MSIRVFGGLIPENVVRATTDAVNGISELSIGSTYCGNFGPAPANSLVIYGDSHGQQGHGKSVSGTLKYDYLYADAYPWWVQSLSGCRFNIIGWEATGGKTSTEILAWIDEVLALKPGVVLFNAGTNDFLVAGLSDYATPLANIEDIWARLTNAGIRVITITIPVLDPTVGGLSDAESVALKNVNHYLRERASNYPGVTLVDAWSIGVNPTSATGAQKTNYLRADKTHMTNLYAYAVGKAIVAAIDGIIPPINRLVSSIADCSGISGQSANKNVMVNGLFNTTTGGTAGTGASGTVPAGATVSRVAGAAGTVVVVSAAARADGFGNDMVLTITGDAAETAAGGLIAAKWVPSVTGIVAGDEYYFKCEITVEASPVALHNVYVRLVSDSINPTSTYTGEAGHVDAVATIHPMAEGFTAVYETPVCVFQQGTTAGNFYIRIAAYVGASAAAVVRIGRCSLHKVDGYQGGSAPSRND